MNKKTAAALSALLMCAALAACGETNEPAANDEPVAGGAVTKQTTAAEEKTEAEETKAEKTEAPEEEEPILAQTYEDSFTRAFVAKLDDLDLYMEYDKFRTDGDEGMQLLESTSLTGNGETLFCRRNILVSDTGDEGEQEVLLYQGKLYNKKGDEEKYTYFLDYAETEGLFTTQLMGDPWNMEFVSSDSYSDGTVEEVFNTGESTYTYTYDSSGILISVETERTLINVNCYEEAADIELGAGFEDMLQE